MNLDFKSCLYIVESLRKNAPGSYQIIKICYNETMIKTIDISPQIYTDRYIDNFLKYNRHYFNTYQGLLTGSDALVQQ